MRKSIYTFQEGNAGLRNLLGGKGANLAEMTNMGLPVPPGFTITTEVCNDYTQNQGHFSEELQVEIYKSMEHLEEQTGKKLSSNTNPLLVSVRSGGAISMPGMMDTILNLGLNDQSVEGLSALTNNPRFAYDCYRRLLQMFGDVVFEIDKGLFDQELRLMKENSNISSDADLTAEQLKELTVIFKDIYVKEKQKPFPQDPKEQLLLAINAVFASWSNPRAVIYRETNHIPHNLGTAVNIQSMVFGNSGNTSGTGVVFTRNPATGEKILFGEFLLNAQGEDVVAGIRTPQSISELETVMPTVYQQLLDVCQKLESRFKDMQDIEFTIEQEKLFMLQTRNGKRTAKAAFQVASDLVDEEILTEEEAVLSIDPTCIDQLLHPIFDQEILRKQTPIAQGLPASPGAACGAVYFASAEARRQADQGKQVIMVRYETSPDDIEGTIASQAVVTCHGGMTSHAAVVARGLGKCCVAGCDTFEINEEKRIVICGDHVIKEGDILSVDGSTGKIYLGEIPTVSPKPDQCYERIMNWANQYRRLQVYANADTKTDIQTAVNFGAEGVGLARTEHMFFEKKKLQQMRILILSTDESQRQEALDKLLAMQIHNFTDLYEVMQDKPITIRLLDPPLHEFLPSLPEDITAISKEINIPEELLHQRISDLSEVNPMLGHRGCRIGITFPEIYEMQVEAIIRSALSFQDNGVFIVPEIMIPLVGYTSELEFVKERVITRIEDILAETGKPLTYHVGTMIEVPRACLVADDIAQHADFFSFGTNDLTQMACGFSRDDIAKFMHIYLNKGILPADPFQILDITGVGQLIEMATVKGRQSKPDLSIGVCGEVGGDPASIEFFEKIKLKYVSCSPYRLPIAMLASAQAALRQR